MVDDEDYLRVLERAKSEATLQLLFKAARLLNERALARVRARTGKPVRVVHTSLLPHVDLAGTRLTDLAARLGVTKQAAGQIVDELVGFGMLERVDDPADARAKLVCFSKRGRASILEGLGVLRELEAELTEDIGEPGMRRLHTVLSTIVAREATRKEPPAPAPSSRATRARARPSRSRS